MSHPTPAAAPAAGPFATWLRHLGRPFGPATPAPAVALPPAPATPFATPLAETEVTDVALAQLLASACIDAVLTPVGLLRCSTLAGHKFNLAVRENVKLLQLWTIMPGDAERHEELHRAASALNNTLYALRTAVDEDGDIVLDLCLSYAGGLLPRQLLHTIAVLEVQCANAAERLKL